MRDARDVRRAAVAALRRASIANLWLASPPCQLGAAYLSGLQAQRVAPVPTGRRLPRVPGERVQPEPWAFCCTEADGQERSVALKL